MEPGAVPVDADDIIQRYGRRLFVLAYHLTGDGPRADELAQECLIRSLLEQAFPAGDRETAVYLIRGLVSLWKERLEPPARSVRLRDKGAATAAPDPRPGDPAALWGALSRLDPTSRAVLVLRVAGDLEYETIGRILDMAADVVYARLLQARSRLHPEATAISNAVSETMNLYLDGRLGGQERGEFERLLGSDRSLRGRVEFHRGLTLDLHEEAPPLPRDFAARIHDRLDRTRETLALVDQAVDQAVDPAGREPVAAAPIPVSPAPVSPTPPSRRPAWVWAAGVVVLVIAVAGVTFRVARRLPVGAPAATSGAAAPPASASPSATPDEETIEALRSLGYLAPAPGKKGSKPAATATPKPGRSPRPSAAPARQAATPAPIRSPAPTPAPEPTPAPTPAPTDSPAPEPSPQPTPLPTPEPIPEPAPQTTATPEPQPSPAPTASPTPEPVPVRTATRPNTRTHS